MEIKRIVDFPDYYISDTGRVFSDKTTKYKCKRGWYELKGFVCHNGYRYVDLVDQNKHKRYGIHQLVAQYFVEGYFQGAVIDHKDRNKTNNIKDNLRWVTQQENIKYSYDTMPPTRNYYYYYLYNTNNKKYGPFKGFKDVKKYIERNNLDIAPYSLQMYGHSRGWTLKKINKEIYEK